ncbi:DUF305 domain-containing protein [Streptomyces jumonjinensis]|uniref:DUF305 domain-containing protein n=1 Tax=Streptomyces jumonjinensis TaxID=1945 RepID=UPI0037B41510
MTVGKNTPRTPRVRRRIAIVGTDAAAGLAVAGFVGTDGVDDGSKASTTASAPAGQNPAPGAFNDADVMFARTMIPHHEQALEMSELADGRAQDAEVKKLAAQIAGAQDPEIQKMKSWLTAWGEPVSADSMPGMDHGSGSSHGSGMSGMMTEQDMADLTAAKGTDFDRKFAQMMIDHHKGAVTMAEDEQKNGENATAKELADDVVKNQTAEIDQFYEILGRL